MTIFSFLVLFLKVFSILQENNLNILYTSDTLCIALVRHTLSEYFPVLDGLLVSFSLKHIHLVHPHIFFKFMFVLNLTY